MSEQTLPYNSEDFRNGARFVAEKLAQLLPQMLRERRNGRVHDIVLPVRDESSRYLIEEAGKLICTGCPLLSVCSTLQKRVAPDIEPFE